MPKPKIITSLFTVHLSLITFILFFFCSLFTDHLSLIYASESVHRSLITDPSVSVSASIEETTVTIWGYTSPASRVELSGSNTFSVTYSNHQGFYEFNQIVLIRPLTELCLTATDISTRRSSPVCIPAPPDTDYHSHIGPIILCPTLTLDSDNIKPNSTAFASGQSLPDSPVDIYFFQVNDQASVFPVKPAQAFSLPKLTTTTDSEGNYSFSLPTAYSSNYRLFAVTQYEGEPSPKSNTLTFNLPSLFYLFWLENQLFFLILPIFVITLTLFFWLIYLVYLKPKTHHLPALYWGNSCLLKPQSPFNSLFDKREH